MNSNNEKQHMVADLPIVGKQEGVLAPKADAATVRAACVGRFTEICDVEPSAQ